MQKSHVKEEYSPRFSSDQSDRLKKGNIKQITKRTQITYKKSESINLDMGEVGMFVRLLVLGALVLGLVLCRYAALYSITAKHVFLFKAAIFTTELYINTLTIDLTIVEMVLFDNKSTVNFTSPLEYYYIRRDIMQTRVVDIMPELLDTYVGRPSDRFRELSDENMCEILAKTDEKGTDFINCEEAMSGIANNPLRRFIQLYLTVTDSIVNTYKLGSTREDRLSLMSDDRFLSLTAYACYNQLGLADAMYYHYILPIYTEMTLNSANIHATIILTNIATVAMGLVLVLAGWFLVLRHFAKIQLDYWNFVLAIPIRLIELSLVLTRRLTDAAKHSVTINNY